MSMQQHSIFPRALRRLAILLCGAACPWLAGAQATAQSPALARPPVTRTAPPAPPAAAAPAPMPFRLRVVGGLADLPQYTQLEAPFWFRELPRLSGGRFQADIVPFDRAGVPGMEMLRLLQLGVVPFGTTLMSSLSGQYPQYTAADLPGLNPDIATLRATVAAFRPYLEQALRDEHGVEALAIYLYPAQAIFCKRPMAGLRDLAGRRVRVSSAGQADFVSALGGVAVLTTFKQIVPSLETGDTECAITGTMSGNTLGLHTLTTHLHPMPITWGLAIFGANRAAWEALPAELRALLRAELPRLEAAIWSNAERQTADGIACNAGRPGCVAGRKGAMAVVAPSAQDERLRQEIFGTTVLPQWLRRCSARCADVWNRTIGPARGIAAPATP